MDYQGQRKRAFSQAFQRINQPRLNENNIQPAKRILSDPVGSTGTYQQASNQENEYLLDLDCPSAFDQIPGTQIRHPPPVELQYVNPALYEYASVQYDLYGNGPGPVLRSGSLLSPSVSNLHSEEPVLREPALPTPHIVRGQSMFGRSPYVRPDYSPPLNDIIHSYTQAGLVSTDKNGGSPMSDTTTAVELLTPSALNFSDLSLNGQGYSTPSFPLQKNAFGNRVTVRAVPASFFVSHFSQINPNEVVVLFDKGREIRKVDKYPLCIASRFFAQLLDGPFLDHGFVHCIRLRDDLPYAITVMLHFIETGHYVIDQRAFKKFPLLTALDLHIHAYLVGSKYGIVDLEEFALNAYCSVAEHEMSLGFLALFGGRLSDIQSIVPESPVVAPANNYNNEQLMTMPMDRWLNSLVLLWRNTPSRYDALRTAVLELINRDVNKLLRVPFFVTLMQEMVGFGDDIVASLEDDGFEVKAVQARAGVGQSHTVRFGV